MNHQPRPYENPLAVEKARARTLWAQATPLLDPALTALAAQVEGERYTRFLGPAPYGPDDFTRGYEFDSRTAAYLAAAANALPALLREVQAARAAESLVVSWLGDTVGVAPDEMARLMAEVQEGKRVELPGGATIERIDHMDRVLSIGRIVHYVLDQNSKHPGECRPAMVVRVWDQDAGTCNLLVFTDGENDYLNPAAVPSVISPPRWETSVRSAPAVPASPGSVVMQIEAWGTWHWPD